MTLSTQTKADLASILETLDQRIHELTCDQHQSGEAQALQTLRANAAAMLGGSAGAA